MINIITNTYTELIWVIFRKDVITHALQEIIRQLRMSKETTKVLTKAERSASWEENTFVHAKLKSCEMEKIEICDAQKCVNHSQFPKGFHLDPSTV